MFGSKKCEDTGKSADTCNKETGQCTCKCNVEGTKCDKCKPSFYGFPETADANCLGKNKHIPMPQNYTACAIKNSRPIFLIYGFYSKIKLFTSKNLTLNIILACFCNHHGSKDDMCDQITGKCTCKDGYTAKTCDECKSGYSGFPNCQVD